MANSKHNNKNESVIVLNLIFILVLTGKFIQMQLFNHVFKIEVFLLSVSIKYFCSDIFEHKITVGII